MNDTQVEAPRPPAPASSGWLRLLAEAAIATALTIVTFGKCLGPRFQFLTPDYDWLALARYGDGELESLKKTLTAYRGFAGALFQSAYHFFGADSATPYRMTLIVIHIINSVMCGRLVARVLGRPQAAWIAAALFAVAPASSEAICNISGFVYPCVTFLMIAGLLLYDQAIEMRSAARWAGAFVCFGVAGMLREHWVTAFPLIVLLEIARAEGFVALRSRGFWLRLGPVVAAGAAILVYRHIVRGAQFLPSIPEYQFDGSMVSRLIVTLQRLVLPPVPLDIGEYIHVHQAIGVVLILGAIYAIFHGSRSDRWRAGALCMALFIALIPFLPVVGDHIRQRFAYFGTAFAAGVAAYSICLASERISPRVTIPIVLAMLVGLELEQQTEFERDYTTAAAEASARIPSYAQAAEWVRSEDDIAFFVGDRQPNFVGISSMMRVLHGVSRKQLMQIKISSFDQFLLKYQEIKERAHARGRHRIFLRGSDGFDYIRVTALEEAIRHVFETGVDAPRELTVFVLLPRPLDAADGSALASQQGVESAPNK
jgi:hypothetical protein